MTSQRCGKLTGRGTACKNWAVRDSDPPACGAHGGGAGRPGPPEGSQNAFKHGVYAGALPDDLSGVIAGLHKRLGWVRVYIDRVQAKEDLEAEGLVKLIDLEGRLSNRIGRLMRDKKAVTGEEADSIEGDFAVVSALAFEVLGVNVG